MSQYEYTFTKNGLTDDMTQLQDALEDDSSTDGINIHGIFQNDTSTSTITLIVDTTLTPTQQTDIQTFITNFNQPFPVISWAKIPSAFIHEEQPTGIHSGTINSGWNVRNLNSVSGQLYDGGVVTLSGNQFTIKPGTYNIRANVPSYKTNQYTARIKTIGGTIVLASDNGLSKNEQTSVVIAGEIIITATTTYVLEHWAATGVQNTGGGVAAGVAGQNEIYSQVHVSIAD